VTPSQQMLDDPDTRFPVHIDPGFTANRSAWTMANYGSPNTAYWNSAEDAFVGSWNAGSTRWRSMFNYDTAGTAIVGQHIVSATLNLYEKWSHTCSPRQFLVYSMATPATPATTWNNSPGGRS